jgi:hypothetical protein
LVNTIQHLYTYMRIPLRLAHKLSSSSSVQRTSSNHTYRRHNYILSVSATQTIRPPRPSPTTAAAPTAPPTTATTSPNLDQNLTFNADGGSHCVSPVFVLK